MSGQKKIEFIESYIKIGDADYQWSDNRGELIRCRDCAHWWKENGLCTDERTNGLNVFDPDFYCGYAERR